MVKSIKFPVVMLKCLDCGHEVKYPKFPDIYTSGYSAYWDRKGKKYICVATMFRDEATNLGDHAMKYIYDLGYGAFDYGFTQFALAKALEPEFEIETELGCRRCGSKRTDIDESHDHGLMNLRLIRLKKYKLMNEREKNKWFRRLWKQWYSVNRKRLFEKMDAYRKGHTNYFFNRIVGFFILGTALGVLLIIGALLARWIWEVDLVAPVLWTLTGFFVMLVVAELVRILFVGNATLSQFIWDSVHKREYLGYAEKHRRKLEGETQE